VNRLALLITLVCACSSPPSGLHAPGGGSQGAGGAGGSVVGPLPSSGSPGTGGAGVSNPGYIAGAGGGMGGADMASGGIPGAGRAGRAGGIASTGGDVGIGGIVGAGGAVGTGGSSSGGARGSCSNVPAYGGDVVGTWTVMSSCLSVAGQMDMALFGLGCTSATVTGSLQVTGTWTANSNGTYSDHTTTTGVEHLTLPASCLQISGTTTTCDRIGGVLTGAGYDSVSCTAAASGGCTCSATVKQTGWMGMVSFDASTSGEYTTSGTEVTLDSEARYSFCVAGTKLNMTPQGTNPTSTGTVNLQKSASTGSGGVTATGGSGGTTGSGGVGAGGMGGTGGEMADAQVSCSPQSECPNDMVCGFSIVQGCSALGACLLRPTPSPCNAIIQLSACGCDGKTIGWTGGCSPSLPDGFAPAPVVHNGACPSGS